MYFSDFLISVVFPPSLSTLTVHHKTVSISIAPFTQRVSFPSSLRFATDTSSTDLFPTNGGHPFCSSKQTRPISVNKLLKQTVVYLLNDILSYNRVRYEYYCPTFTFLSQCFNNCNVDFFLCTPTKLNSWRARWRRPWVIYFRDFYSKTMHFIIHIFIIYIYIYCIIFIKV